MGYIYVAETATTRLRAKTTGVAIFGIQGMATVYVYIAPIMLNSPALGMSNTGKGKRFHLPNHALTSNPSQSSSGWALEPSFTLLCGSWFRRQRVALSLSWMSYSNAEYQLGSSLRRRLKSLAGAKSTTLASLIRLSQFRPHWQTSRSLKEGGCKERSWYLGGCRATGRDSVSMNKHCEQNICLLMACV